MDPASTIQWKAYPALLAAGVVALGIGLGEACPGVPLVVWAALSILGMLTLWAAAVHDRRRLVSLAPLLRTAGVALALLGAGAMRQAAYQTPSPQDVGRVADALPDRDTPVTLKGTVADAPATRNGTVRFTLHASQVLLADSAAVSGHVRVTLYASPWDDPPPTYPAVHEGDILRLQGRLERPGGPRNPGAFDYRAYLERRRVCCTLFVDAASDVTVLGTDRGGLGARVVAARQHVRRTVGAFVPSAPAQGVLQALLLGDRSGISSERRAAFVATGLAHLLAVSGLHVVLVGMVLYGLLRPLLMRLRLRWQAVEITRAAVTIAVLVFYMMLTGARPSVVRAVVMASLLIGGILAQRSAPTLNTLGVAALVLMAMQPTTIFEAGFQLSLSAVAGIVTIHPRLMERLPETWREHPAGGWLASTVSVSAGATLGTAPVLLAHFEHVSMAGLLLNVPAIPLTAVGLTAGILTVLAGGVLPGAASAFGSAADACIGLLLQTATWGTVGFGWMQWMPGAVPGWALGALVLGTGAVAQWPRPSTRWRCMIAAGVLLVFGTWKAVVTERPGLDIVFLDVGQGDAALLSTPDGSHVLVDAGPRSRTRDAGRWVVVPYLKHRGIDRLDAVVITHPDSDHLGGLPTVLRGVEVGRVIHSGWEADTDLYRETIHLIDSLDVPSHAAREGDRISVDRSVRVDVLGPPMVNEGQRLLGENDASVVLRVVFGRTSVLLTGDVEKAGEELLVARYGKQLRSNVVKVAHHGSSTSSTRAFLQHAVSREDSSFAVISVGRHNRFGMPHEEVLTRWQETSSIVRSTARSGAVWLRSNGQSIREIPWRVP